MNMVHFALVLVLMTLVAYTGYDAYTYRLIDPSDFD